MSLYLERKKERKNGAHHEIKWKGKREIESNYNFPLLIQYNGEPPAELNGNTVLSVQTDGFPFDRIRLGIV